MSKTHEERENQSLIDLANTTTDDLYAILSLPNPFSGLNDEPTHSISKTELTKAWRQAALKWHPDKNRGNEEAAATKLDISRKAFEVLSDPAARQRYDDKLRAKQQWEIRHRAKDQRRRKLAEDLEKQETAAFGIGKRKREEGEENRKETEAQRLVEKARQMKMARNEQRQQQVKEEAEEARRREQETHATNGSERIQTSTKENGGLNGSASETDRTVKVRWISPKTGDDETNTEPSIEFKSKVQKLFSNFGEISDIYFLKNKMARPSVDDPIPKGGDPQKTRKPKKRLMSTAAIVFKSSVGAYAAVWDASRQAQNDQQKWDGFDSCYWWSGSEPSAGTHASSAKTENPEPAPPKVTKSFSFKPPVGSSATQDTNGQNDVDKSSQRDKAREEEKNRARIRKEEIDRILREEAAEEAAGENAKTYEEMDQEP